MDPLAEKTYGWSPYRYAFNNPVRFIDPKGLAEEEYHENSYGGRNYTGAVSYNMGGPTVSIPTPTGTPTESPSQQPENTAQEGNGNDKVQEGEKAQSTDVQTNTDAPKHTNAYDGAWGKVKYFLFGGIEGMGQYDINGNLIGPAPITGMAPTPNFKGGSNVLKWSKVMKGKDVVKMLEKIGFKQVGQKGSHVQLKLFGIGPKVTVPVHGSNTLAPGTLKSIIKQVEEAINSIH